MNPPASLKFLIATDIHLGHAQNHQQLGNDSYEAFQEVLEIAKKQNVDFLLLGGDLFDEVNPSQKTLFKCLNILRQNIFGHQKLALGVQGIKPNFSQQNLNICLPIFTIHGNHDYPSNDFGKISVCDLLHASRYVNYFGKHLCLAEQGDKKIVVSPLIFEKKGWQRSLAIYGLGYIKDMKLHKMLQEGAVIFEEPPKKQQTVCILVLHQNRFKGKKGGVGASYENCIHPEQLPKWMNLIVWGHQHEAIYKVQIEAEMSILQPGSTVITSFIEAESLKKQCSLVTVRDSGKYEVVSQKLEKSYRPMVTQSYSLAQITAGQKQPFLFDFDAYFDAQISMLIGQIKQNTCSNKKPIIRLKIDYTGHEIIRLIAIEQKYRDLVANGNKIFTYSQKRPTKNAIVLEDSEVMAMIKTGKVPRNLVRETELTQQIMELFTQEMVKTKLNFYTVDELKDKITDYSAMEIRGTVGDLKAEYKEELQTKSSKDKQSIVKFHQEMERQFRKVHEKLLRCTNSSGEKQTLNQEQIRAYMRRLKDVHAQKIKQVGEKFTQSSPAPGQTQTQKPAIRAKKIKAEQAQFVWPDVVKSKLKGEQSKHLVQSPKLVWPEAEIRKKASLNKNKTLLPAQPQLVWPQAQIRLRVSQEQKRAKHSHQHSHSSSSNEEEDCCKKAQKQEYLENQTRVKFEQAQKMAKGKKKEKKSAKSVRFKDQQ